MSSLKALVCLTAAFILQIQLVEKNFLRAEASINDPVTNLTAFIGEKITLPCVFKEKLDCEWLRNKSQFSATARGINLPTNKTTNCSITLSEIEQKDFTNWTCCSTSTTANRAKVCSEIRLSQTFPTPTSPITIAAVVLSSILALLILIALIYRYVIRKKEANCTSNTAAIRYQKAQEETGVDSPTDNICKDEGGATVEENPELPDKKISEMKEKHGKTEYAEIDFEKLTKN